MISHLLNQEATIYTQTRDKYGDNSLSSPITTSCRFRYITEIEKQQNAELMGSVAQIWFEPETAISEGSIVKAEDTYWRVNRLVKARRVDATVEFLKAYVDKYQGTTEVVVEIPVAPVALSATNITIDGFQVNWETVANATSYLYDLSDQNDFSNLILEDVEALDVFDTITGLNPDTTYYFRVRAVNSAGTSDSSNVITITTLVENQIPAKPTITSVTNITATGFTLNWNSITFADNYRVQVATDIEFNNLVEDISSITELFQDITGLNQNTNYYCRVWANNEVMGNGEWSNTETVKTSIVTFTVANYHYDTVTHLISFTSDLNETHRVRLRNYPLAHYITDSDPTTNFSNVVDFNIWGTYQGEDIAGATEYVIIEALGEFGNDIAFSQPIKWTDLIANQNYGLQLTQGQNATVQNPIFRSSPFTFSFKVKADDYTQTNGGGNVFLACCGDGDYYWNWYFIKENGSGELNFWGEIASQTLDNNEHLFTIIGDTGQGKTYLYMDTTLVATHNGLPSWQNYPLVLGGYPLTGPKTLEGVYKDVKYWNVAFSGSDVATLAGGTDPRSGDLIARWDLNGNLTDTVSGNNLNSAGSFI